MQTYDDMVIGSIPLIGKVPREWNKTRVFAFANERKEFTEDESAKLLSISEYFGVAPRNEKFADSVGGSRDGSIAGYRVVRKNDLAMNYMLAWKGSQGVSNYDGVVSPAYAVFKLDQSIVVPQFIHYLFRSELFQRYFKSLSRGIMDSRLRLYPETLLHMSVNIPSRATQHKIAEYLDVETAKIDGLIVKQERLLQLLEEKRRATITQAVTRGLNPHAELKETGLPWLGEVPAHWKREKLKYIGDSIIGLTYSPSDLSDEGTLVLRSMNIANGQINTDTQIFVSKPIPEKLLTKENDLLICSRNGSRKLIGKCGLISRHQQGHTFGVFNTIFRSRYNPYIYYILNSNIFYAQLGLFMTSTINQLTVNTLNNFEIALPPDDEQGAIVAYLKSFEDELGVMKEKVQRQIELLKERRVSLISNVVTGKVKV